MKDESKYVEATVSALKTAIADAEAVLNDTKATDLEISEAAAAISKAAAELTLKASQTITVTTQIKKNESSAMFNLGAKNDGDGTLKYSSSNSKIAMVDANGNVSINGTGKAIITVTAQATEKSAETVKEVTIIVSPNKQTVKSVKATGKKKIKVSWKKNTKASGYQIKLATNKKFTKNVKTVNVNSGSKKAVNVKKLKKGTTYFVKMRAYVVIDGQIVYGAYGAAKKVTTKK